MITNAANPAVLTLQMETRILGVDARTIAVPLPDAPIRVAALIRAKISAEWLAFRAGGGGVVGRESLPPDKITGPQPNEHASLEAAVRAALDGCRSGWYIILVDGEQPGGMDVTLRLAPSSRIAFVRVYPLPDTPTPTTTGNALTNSPRQGDMP